MTDRQIIGQRAEDDLPRYAGIATFALLPRLEDVEHADIAVVGIPFDSGTSFRPGARFGPSYIREHSRQLHPYHAVHDAFPFRHQQVVTGLAAVHTTWELITLMGLPAEQSPTSA